MTATVSIIAALARNRVIGAGDRLPWHLPADLKRFKQLTLDHTVVMGRKTFDSIGKPLPRRKNVVITRGAGPLPAGVVVARSVAEALALAADDGEVFIAGGGEIYRQTIDLAAKMYLTVIDADFEGDAYFPEYDASAWSVVERSPQPRGELPFDYAYVTLERVAKLART